MSSKDRKHRTIEQGDYELSVDKQEKKKSSSSKETRSSDRKHHLGVKEMNEENVKYKINKHSEDGSVDKESRRRRRGGTGKEESGDGREIESDNKQRHNRADRKVEMNERDKSSRKKYEDELNDSKRNRKKEKEVGHDELERRHRKEPSEELNELKRHKKKEKDVEIDERERRQMKERVKETNEIRQHHRKENEDVINDVGIRNKRSKDLDTTGHDIKERSGEEVNEMKTSHRRGSDNKRENIGNGKNDKDKSRHQSKTEEINGKNKTRSKLLKEDENREELIGLASEQSKRQRSNIDEGIDHRKHGERARRRRDKGDAEMEEYKAKQKDSHVELEEVDYDDDFEGYDEDEFDDAAAEDSSGGSIGLAATAVDDEGSAAGTRQAHKAQSNQANIPTSVTLPPAGAAKPNNKSIGQFQSSFINFRTAQKKYSHDLVANRMLSRAYDLSRLIEMDRAEYDILEMAPLLEHSQYMRLFGKAGCVHGGSQTGSDSVSRDSQTEAIDERIVWTQCPPLDDHECVHIVCNSEVVSDGAEWPRPAGDSTRAPDDAGDDMAGLLPSGSLLQALTRMDNVLQEEASCALDIHVSGDQQHPSKVISKGYSKFSIAHGMDCLIARFAVANSNIFATVQQASARPPPDTTSSDKQQQPGAPLPSIAVWNLARSSANGDAPSLLLACPNAGRVHSSSISQLTFSPDPAAAHVICGLSSGALALWDLRENHSRARCVPVSQLPPAYLTDASTCDEGPQSNHKGPIVGLQPIINNQMDANSYQLLSLDSCGHVTIWMVSHVAHLNQWSLQSGSLTDLNLRPGARYRLSRVAFMHMVPNVAAISNPYVITSAALDPSCSTNLFCGTNTGQIIHHKRAANQRITNKRAISQPRSLGATDIFETGTVTQLDYYPFFESYLLAGYDDGTIRIFAVGRSQHLLTFHYKPGSAILQLKWSRSHPAIFFSLDMEGNLCAWNILLNQNHPLLVQSLPGYIGFDVSSDSKWEFPDRTVAPAAIATNINNKARLLLWALDGRVEVHELSDAFSNPELDDSFKASSLLQSFM